ncbi:MAG: antibiotic biosynthesis monooxygenase family protein [Bacteroidota bacterium]
MIVRIVRMEFRPEAVAEFHAIFEASKSHIRSFPGCTHLELHQDAQFPNVRWTYSHWEAQDRLDAYRQSELFGQVWPQTKALFAAKPQAFSLVLMETVSGESLHQG